MCNEQKNEDKINLIFVCRTIQVIDTENKFEVTNEIKVCDIEIYLE